jgi:hypothetical protein
MADIKQAAEWADEGHSIKRPKMKGWFSGDSNGNLDYCDPSGVYGNRRLNTMDILADDWEIAE